MNGCTLLSAVQITEIVSQVTAVGASINLGKVSLAKYRRDLERLRNVPLCYRATSDVKKRFPMPTAGIRRWRTPRRYSDQIVVREIRFRISMTVIPAAVTSLLCAELARTLRGFRSGGHTKSPSGSAAATTYQASRCHMQWCCEYCSPPRLTSTKTARLGERSDRIRALPDGNAGRLA